MKRTALQFIGIPLLGALLLTGCSTKVADPDKITLTEVQLDHIDNRIKTLSDELKLSSSQAIEVKKALSGFTRAKQAIREAKISGGRKLKELKKAAADYEAALKKVLSNEQYNRYYRYKWAVRRKVWDNINRNARQND